MNKKEREEFEALKEELRRERSKRFVDCEVKPDIPPPLSGVGNLTKGYQVTGYLESIRAERACSSAVNHAVGQDVKTTSQRSIWLYSSELLALRAARYLTEQKFLEILVKIDRKIEELEANEVVEDR